jgi:hypothetical protein
MRRNDDLNAARGIINGIAFGLAVWLIILAIFAIAARAEMVDVQPTSNTLLEYALTPAAQYWAARGESLPSKPQLFEYTEQGISPEGHDPRDITARASRLTSRILWNRLTLKDWLRDAYDPWRGLAREALWDICQTTTHEMGHLLGHGHTDISDLHNYDLMAPDGGETVWVLNDGTRLGGYIAECKTWAKTILDARAKRSKVRAARAQRRAAPTGSEDPQAAHPNR